MALGGGFFSIQNKILPGAYINFVSASKASSAISDRGYVAIPFELDWGLDGDIFTATANDIQEESLKLFGYTYSHRKLKNLREVFKNAKTVYCYRLNSGIKASNEFAAARCSGIRGNDIRIVIQTNVDDESYFDVITMIDNTEVDIQVVQSIKQLKDNDFVTWKRTKQISRTTDETLVDETPIEPETPVEDIELHVTAGEPLTGGANKTEIESSDYQNFLDKAEKYSFNTLGCTSSTKEIIDLFIQYTKRLRDENGIKFQTVVYKTNADYEGIISVENNVLDENANESSLVYWVSGANAGCAINKSNTNKIYDGEYIINVDYKQSELEDAIKSGKFIFHKVIDDCRVLEDINTLTTVVDSSSINDDDDTAIVKAKSSDFSSNQVVRTLDQIGNDIAVLFNTHYLGKVPNDNSGRISFWNDLVRYGKELNTIKAIENFEPNEVIVEQGNDKKSISVIYPITPIMAMSKLYMKVVVQ